MIDIILTAVLSSLMTAFCMLAYQMYSFYRKHGQTRKQALLTAWRMWNE